jgi:inhibitor of cysteine peptidase
MKKEIPLIALLTAAILISGISGCKPDQTGIANPASVYCINNGYNLSIRTASDGSQTGYCVFPDGKECEEWAFYRGECRP